MLTNTKKNSLKFRNTSERMDEDMMDGYLSTELLTNSLDGSTIGLLRHLWTAGDIMIVTQQ